MNYDFSKTYNLKPIRGFTLIELLVVIGIIGLLSTIVVATLSNVRTKAQNTKNQASDANIYHVVGGAMVGEWRMDECSGATVKDTSGNGNDGTLVNSPSWSTDTPFGTGCSLSLDGSNKDVSVTPNSNLNNIPNAITLTAWVKSSNWRPTAVWRAIIDKNSYGIYVKSNSDVFRFQLSLVGDGVVTLDTGVVSTGDWHFVVGTYDKNAGADNFRLYLDGGLQSKYTYTGAINTTSYNLYIGFYQGGYLNGLVDNVRVYSDILPFSQIQKLYAEGRAAHPNALAVSN